MATKEIQERITKEREAVDAAQSQIAELSAQRTQELEAGNDKRVDDIERDIQAAESTIARGEERLTLLDQRLAEAQEQEQSRELDDLIQQAAHARKIGEQLIKKDYQKAAAEVSAVMAKLSAIDKFIGSINHRLQRAGRAPVNGPNAMRCKQRQVIERTRTEEIGIGDPRHPLHAVAYTDINGIARHSKTQEPVAKFSDVDVTYTETVEAYGPDPLPRAVRLPGIDGTPNSVWPTDVRDAEISATLNQLGIGETKTAGSKIKSLLTSKAA
jgi:hypothetical protein